MTLLKNITITKSWNISFKTFLIPFAIILPVVGAAQNTSINQFSASDISQVVIDANQIFKINVSETNTELITIKSLSDGEYGNKYQVTSKAVDGVLTIRLEYKSLESIPDDKRNAHKVIAAEVVLELPADKSIAITSDIGSVELNGNYKHINVKLSQGNFTANAIAKEAVIETINGSISLETKDALIETDSHHGLVDIPNDLFGFGVWKLKTHGGTITVKKVE